MDKAIRQKEYQILLQTYHEQLSENIKSMSSDPETLFSCTDFQNELNRLRDPILMQISLAKRANLSDLNEMCEQETGFVLAQNSDPEFEGKYNERMSGVVDDI